MKSLIIVLIACLPFAEAAVPIVSPAPLAGAAAAARDQRVEQARTGDNGIQRIRTTDEFFVYRFQDLNNTCYITQVSAYRMAPTMACVKN